MLFHPLEIILCSEKRIGEETFGTHSMVESSRERNLNLLEKNNWMKTE